MDLIAVRRLYGSVIIQAAKDAVDDALRGSDAALGEFEGWLRSEDGRHVVNLAGLPVSNAAIGGIMSKVGEAVRYRNTRLFARGRTLPLGGQSGATGFRTADLDAGVRA